MQLNEHLLEKAEIVKEGLPKGILARVWYPIMRFGQKNANQRRYDREVAETVQNDEAVQHKLKAHALFGNQEHPELSQIKLDWQQTSHYIPEFKINDSDQTFNAALDLLPSEPGKFIFGLLEAGCLVGVSTRADGELEECSESDGSKFHRVIPSSYKFQTVDFTGDPSTPDAVPSKIIKVAQSHYESKDNNKNVTIALLEYANTDEARKLIESVQADKQHSGCKFKLGEKKCSGKCGHSKVNEDQITQMSSWAETDQIAQKLFNKHYKDLSFQEKEQVLDAQIGKDDGQPAAGDSNSPTKPEPGVAPEDRVADTNKTSSTTITPPVAEVPLPSTVPPERGFYRDGKGELLFVEAVGNEGVKVVRQNGEEETMPIDTWNNLKAEKSEEVTNKSLVSNTTEAKEYFQMAREIRESNETGCKNCGGTGRDTSSGEEDCKCMKCNGTGRVLPKKFSEEQSDEVSEAKIEQYLIDNNSLFTNSSEAVSNLISTFKLSEKKALEFVKKLGEKKVIEVGNLKENYIRDAVLYGTKIAEANRLVAKIQESLVKYEGIEERLTEAQQLLEEKEREILRLQEAGLLQEQTVSQLTTEINQANEVIAEMKEVDDFKIGALHESGNREQKLGEKIKKLEENIEVLRKLRDAAVTAENKRIEENNILNESIKLIKENHRKDIVKFYVNEKVSRLGLKLPAQTLSLLESCSSANEINIQLKQIQNSLREGIVNSSPSLNEIKIESVSQKSPMQTNIDKHVENALKNFGM